MNNAQMFSLAAACVLFSYYSIIIASKLVSHLSNCIVYSTSQGAGYPKLNVSVETLIVSASFADMVVILAL